MSQENVEIVLRKVDKSPRLRNREAHQLPGTPASGGMNAASGQEREVS